MSHATIGILAGMGPSSTGPFIDRVVAECRIQYGAKDDIDFPRMMILSLPTPFYADRATDHEAMKSALRDGLDELGRAGVDFIGIACNTAHVYFDELAGGTAVPLLNMVELALDALPSAARRVALIAARPTSESGIYQRGIVARGRVLVEPAWQPRIDELLEATRASADASVHRTRWRSLVQEAATAGADLVLVACADLSAVGREREGALPILDATDCLARELVGRWCARVHGTPTAEGR